MDKKSCIEKVKKLTKLNHVFCYKYAMTDLTDIFRLKFIIMA
jgi:hypothetical protein